MAHNLTRDPLVSILINNYNYGKFVGDAISSALNQTYPNIEVVVVDDGSTDCSRKIIEQYGDRIVTVFKDNGGQPSAFNAGFANSTGDIICFLDSDDVFETHKIAEIVNVFEKNIDIGYCFHAYYDVEHASRKILGRNPVEQETRLIDFREQIRRGKNPTFAPSTSSLCFSRQLLTKILPMSEEISFSFDNFLKYSAILLEKGFYLDEELTKLRIHENNFYSRKPQKSMVRSKTNLLTAYLFADRFPEAREFARRTFSVGLAEYRYTHSKDEECEKIIARFFKHLSFSEKQYVLLRTAYRMLRMRLKEANP
ncbi:MAG: glycosyltransferase [Cyanobacteria bacterium P01_A01_bin.135]